MNPWLRELIELKKQNKENITQEIPPFSEECFDSNNYFIKLMRRLSEDNFPSAEIIKIIDAAISSGVPKPPWGVKIKNCPVLGDYWLVSDDQAKKFVHDRDAIFTQDSIMLLAEVREICGPKVGKKGKGKRGPKRKQ